MRVRHFTLRRIDDTKNTPEAPTGPPRTNESLGRSGVMDDNNSFERTVSRIGYVCVKLKALSKKPNGEPLPHLNSGYLNVARAPDVVKTPVRESSASVSNYDFVGGRIRGSARLARGGLILGPPRTDPTTA